MADNGTFRTSFKGFHKEDVLSYIDAQQTRHNEELAGMQQQLDACAQQREEAENKLRETERLREQAEESLFNLQAENARLTAQEEDLTRALAEMRQQAAEAEDVRRENRRLTEKQQMLEQESQTAWDKQRAELDDEWQQRLDQVKAEMEAARQEVERLKRCAQEESGSAAQLRVQLDEANRRAAEWEASSRRYEQLIGDVGSFIMEIRAMGQRFLETSYKRSESCLDALDDAVTALERQLADNRADVEQARQELLDSSAAAGLHMEDLLQALEEAGDRASADMTGGEEPRFFR